MTAADSPATVRGGAISAGQRRMRRLDRRCLRRLTVLLTLVGLPLAAGARENAGEDRERKVQDKRGGKVIDYEGEFAETDASRAVDRALVHLQATQQTDGSWVSPLGKNTGVASLCVMAFLARGHTPGRGRFGETLEQAITWVASQSRDGLLVRDASHGPLYSHGISTLMLGEVVGMVNHRRPAFRELASTYTEAVNLILRAQNVAKDRHSTGGWRYHPNSMDSDISCSGWQLLALRSAERNGLPVPRRNIESAVEYIERCVHPLGGFAYQPGGDRATPARTGTGILSLQICGEFNSPTAFRGGDWLLRQPLEWRGPFFYYAAYYCTQGMYQLGGVYWKNWRPLTEALLLSQQNDDGSWPFPPEETFERHAGIPYCTAMAALALSVDFKYLPIYQR